MDVWVVSPIIYLTNTGPVPLAPLEEQIKGQSVARLEELGEALFDFKSHADLSAWLQPHR